MDVAYQLVNIFCEIDDFCKEFDEYAKHKFFPSNSTERKHGPACGLSDSEIMTILVAFQTSGYRNFKTFYCGYLTRFFKHYFPSLPTYERFVFLIKKAALPLLFYSQIHQGKQTGIYYIDSTCLPVCHLKRSRRNKVFKEIAQKGKTSIGWFFGLKLHIVINDECQLIAFRITKGNVHDTKPTENLFKNLSGLAFGDKGYLGKELFEKLLKNGLKLITRKRKNMKNNTVLDSYEKQLLNQRNIVETVFNKLKNHYQIWHTRHRSVLNAMTHLLAALVAYIFEPLELSAIKRLS
jgi:DDE family transposase